MGEPIGASPEGQPEIGVAVNVGGAAVTNCVAVLKRVKGLKACHTGRKPSSWWSHSHRKIPSTNGLRTLQVPSI